MSLFKIDLASGRGCFCGVGNINLIINDNKEMLYAQPLPEKGYFPSKPLQYKVHEFQFPKAGWFALYSDGIRIRPKQLHHLYEMIGPDNKEKATDDVNALSICNVNDDATLLIGKSV